MTNRPVCDVLEEMRECFKHFNFALLPSLIEEVQLAVNRMDTKHWDLKDWESLKDEISERRLEIKRIKAEKEKMKGNEEHGGYEVDLGFELWKGVVIEEL